MIIQWFPGHMTKAIRKMEANLNKVDSIIYLVDSRAPYSCINPLFEKFVASKTSIFVFNKSDLVKTTELNNWKSFFEKQGRTVVFSNSISGKDTKSILSALGVVNRERLEHMAQKGVNYSVKAMVIGMPNTGKSTLINSLCGNKRTVTGNKPGVTKGEQWVRLDNGIILLDTPGTMSSKIEEESVALNLAFIGCIRDAVLDIEELALQLIKKLLDIAKPELYERYNIQNNINKPLEIYEQVAINRGCLLRGKEIDYTRAANALIDDFRKGRLGKIILELPKDDN